ncbi:MAG: formylglycine-generating enzyme family protein [Leptolyngbya sp. SIO4C1]|nr:formylglycine-generating enzyme family protein [Leptolyngbya sp. SIO4C1]
MLLGCQPLVTQTSAAQCAAIDGYAYIPAGAYTAGSDRTERDYAYAISAAAIANRLAEAEARLRQRRWFDTESERQTIELSAVCLQRQLVTNADYQAFIQATGQPAPGISAADYQAQGFLVHPYAAVEPFLWQGQQYPAGQADHPVVLVSYRDAIAYAAWRSAQTPGRYRLPTAAEWEKAARGTDGRYFPWGSQWQADATRWQGSEVSGTSPVGAYPLSRGPYGTEDMAGNVFEYTSTLVAEGQQSVMKGCAWDDLPGFCRAAYRHTRPVESRHILFGFRLVWEPDASD